MQATKDSGHAGGGDVCSFMWFASILLSRAARPTGVRNGPLVDLIFRFGPEPYDARSISMPFGLVRLPLDW
jgi:hypothetical protein